MSKKQQVILGLSLTILTLSIISIALTSKFISINCALCKKEVQKISYLEKRISYWDDIPILHPLCNSYIIDYLAPNCDMTVGEWLETRGWKPRAEETTGMSHQELLDFINRDYWAEKDKEKD